MMTILPTWIIFALLAPLLWGFVNILDKIILSRFNLSPWTYFALDGFVGMVFAFLIYPWADHPLQSPKFAIILSLTSGLTLAGFTILYFYALKMSDVGIIGILIQSTPIITLFFGILFLNERYSIVVYFGMFLIFIGTIIAATSERKRENSSQKYTVTNTIKASLLMVGADILLSTTYLFQDIAVQETSTLAVFFWQRISLATLSSIVIIVLWNEIKKIKVYAFLLSSTVELLSILGLLSITVAFSTGFLAPVTFFVSTQPIWIIFIVWIISLLYPNSNLRDKNNSRFQQIIACSIVFIGLFLTITPR